jgi:hypothetical protein
VQADLLLEVHLAVDGSAEFHGQGSGILLAEFSGAQEVKSRRAG